MKHLNDIINKKAEELAIRTPRMDYQQAQEEFKKALFDVVTQVYPVPDDVGKERRVVEF